MSEMAVMRVSVNLTGQDNDKGKAENPEREAVSVIRYGGIYYCGNRHDAGNNRRGYLAVSY